MAIILNFPQKDNGKISLMPNVFIQLYEAYKQKQNEIRKKRILFLEQQAFQFFYDLEPLPEIKKSKGVDIPEFIQLKQAEARRIQIAKNKASRAMLNVIADNRINECYTKRVKQLKKLHKRIVL